MPTYSFWKETVDDRFYERGGEPDRPKRGIRCPVCGVEQPDEASVALHLGAAHPLSAPRLLIRGTTVIGERLLHRNLSPDELALANVTELLVAEDGRKAQSWSVAALRDALAGASSSVLDIELRNSRDVGGPPAVETVRIRVDVADPMALNAIDSCFADLAAPDDLDELRVDRFADATSEFRGAARYATALHEYCVSILVKDAARGTGDSLPFAAHQDKLKSALHVLREFPERPVARAVAGFVRFSLTDLVAGEKPSGVPPLDRCVAALAQFAGIGTELAAASLESAELGRCPADRTTDAILENWDRPNADSVLMGLADSALTTDEDAAKCLALVVSRAPAGPNAAGIARRLANHPVFGDTAAQIIKNAG